ncbi:MAG TPA: epoxyqueuosine reductase QueH [Candidatus Omnitrophica bacterium]|nr:epoxyqueuosine reductase QueH [Candidatus Omnitrophota bacterium]
MKILLHICCAVCATSVIERLKSEGWEVEGYFYNPNIHPREEYKNRLENTKFLLDEIDISMVESEYEPEKWFHEVRGFEREKEGGKRCQICFKMRLSKTLEAARKRNIHYFATTLTVSPHKKSTLINRIGRDLGGESFILEDFKKRDGFKRAMQLSRKYNLYRQNYCGCIFSKSHQKSR